MLHDGWESSQLDFELTVLSLWQLWGYRFDPAFSLWLALQVAALLLFLFPLSGTGVQCLHCEHSSSGKILDTAEMIWAFVFFLPLGLAVLEEQCLSITGAPFIAR